MLVLCISYTSTPLPLMLLPGAVEFSVIYIYICIPGKYVRHVLQQLLVV